MIGKVIALVAIVASVVSADCGCLNTCGFNRVVGASGLSVAPTYKVAAALPACGPIASPSCVIDPIHPISGTACGCGCNGFGLGYGYGNGYGYGCGCGCGCGFGYGCGLYGAGAFGGIC